MKEKYYLIKEAAAKVGVETHVLRYWEEELKMEIHRNKMGHRYYTEKDIEVLTKVRDLKEKGLQLKAIRSYLEMRREQIANGETERSTDVIQVVPQNDERVLRETEHRGGEMVPVKHTVMTDEEKMQQFQKMMTRILSKALEENQEKIGKAVGEHAADTVVGRMQGMTREQEERAEERYKKLDQTLREMQKARLEAAAANMHPMDRRKQKRIKRKNGKQPQTVAVKQPEEEKNVEKTEENAEKIE